jgi:carbonic anhydrase
MKSILELINKENNQFVATHDESYFAPHQKSQHPQITLVSCCDSRVQPNVLISDPINKIFAVENIGNQLSTAQGSVDYGILHLHTPVLLIMGHTDCGAIKAFMKGYEKENDDIKKELDTLKVGLSGFDKKADFDAELKKNVQRNIDYQVDLAMKRYKTLIDAGSLTVVGAVYDFLNIFNQGTGRVIVTSINGEKQ